MTGKLYLCGTPIGNLQDITLRVINTLREVDLIAAEDTRQTIKLLNHFDIKKPMMSYHEHNKREKGPEIIEKLKQGLNIALVTDAGMPGVSDPGEDMVKLCIKEHIDVIAVPGVSASITALVLSGLPTGKFVFEGFLPREGRNRKKEIESIANETRTVIVYEAPHRIKGTLKELYISLGNRKVAICRELTKKFEEVTRLQLGDASVMYDNIEPKGEFVIIIEGRNSQEIEQEAREDWKKLSIEEHMGIYIKQGMSKKEAMKKAAVDRGISKRDIYKYIIDNEK